MNVPEKLEAKAGIHGTEKDVTETAGTIRGDCPQCSRLQSEGRASAVSIGSSPGGEPLREPETISINPLQLYTCPENCKRLTKPWKPYAGIPSRIFHESKQYGKRAQEVQRLEAFLFFQGIAHLPSRGTRLHGSVLASIKSMKSEARQWQRVKPSVSIFDPVNGTGHGFPEAWSLTPEYLLEILESERTERRYQYGGRTASRYYARKPQKPAGLPAAFAEYLQRGTGLFPYLLPAVDLLYGSQDYESFTRILQSWRYLTLCTPGQEIRLEWSVSDKCGRLSARKPPLQRLPQPMRLRCFSGNVSELDFKGCHLNLLRSLNGMKPLADPWKEIAEELEGQGYRVTEEIVKKLIHPVMYGRGKGYFCTLNTSVVDNPRGLYDSLKRMIPENPEPNALMFLESKIMLSVLERMRTAGIPSGLPVYDSITTQYPEQVQAIMQEASREISGFEQPVKVSSSAVGNA